MRRAEYERLRALHSMNPLALSLREILFNRSLSSASLDSHAVYNEEHLEEHLEEQQEEQLPVLKVEHLTSASTSQGSQEAGMEAADAAATDGARARPQDRQPAEQKSSSTSSVAVRSERPVRPHWARGVRKNIRNANANATSPATRAALQSQLLQELVPHEPAARQTTSDPLHWFHALRKRKLD